MDDLWMSGPDADALRSVFMYELGELLALSPDAEASRSPSAVFQQLCDRLDASNLNAVAGVAGAGKCAADADALLKLQNDFLANAEARLTDVVRSGLVLISGLKEQGELAGLDLPKDVAYSVDGLMFEVFDLVTQLTVLREKFIRLGVDGKKPV